MSYHGGGNGAYGSQYSDANSYYTASYTNPPPPPLPVPETVPQGIFRGMCGVSFVHNQKSCTRKLPNLYIQLIFVATHRPALKSKTVQLNKINFLKN